MRRGAMRALHMRGRLPPELELARVAARSLGVAALDFVRAMGALDGTNEAPTERATVTADALMVRCLDMLQALGRESLGGIAIADLRAELVERCGEAFCEKVAAMGEPAHDAAKRFAASHKIHAVNLARLRQACHFVSRWVTNGGSGRFLLAGSSRLSSCGRHCVSLSLEKVVSRRCSLSGSISARTASRSSLPLVSLNSPCVAQAERSSSRRTRPSAPRFESRTASSVETPAQSASPPEVVSFGRRGGTPDAVTLVRSWNLHLLRVQNLRLSLQFLGARKVDPGV